MLQLACKGMVVLLPISLPPVLLLAAYQTTEVAFLPLPALGL